MNFLSFLYRSSSPFEEGYCPVGDGHELHYMAFGNPKGQTIIRFHGGPGGGASARQAQVFDLKKYRVLVFDQRGCKLSRSKDIYRNNTPAATVEDAVKVLKHLKWPLKHLIVAGSSYGATLALLFAIRYPKTVSALLLSAVFLGRAADLAWTEQSALFYPDLMAQMREKIKKSETLAAGYFRLASSDSLKAVRTALAYYGQYEENLGRIQPGFKPLKAVYEDSLRSLRLFLYYETNRLFLEENEILKNMGKIREIPMFIVHNRLDMTCPVSGAYELACQASKAELVIVPDIGHISEKLYQTFKRRSAVFLKRLRL